MNGCIADIETLTEENTAFRHVLYTCHHLLPVVMALLPGADMPRSVTMTTWWRRLQTSSSRTRRPDRPKTARG